MGSALGSLRCCVHTTTSPPLCCRRWLGVAEHRCSSRAADCVRDIQGAAVGCLLAGPRVGEVVEVGAARRKHAATLQVQALNSTLEGRSVQAQCDAHATGPHSHRQPPPPAALCSPARPASPLTGLPLFPASAALFWHLMLQCVTFTRSQ